MNKSLCLLMLCLAACRTPSKISSEDPDGHNFVLSKAEITSLFGAKRGCLVVQDIDSGEVVFESDPQVCGERRYACSTFKIPIAVMGFDSGVINRDSIFKWDRQKKLLKAWENDQTIESWLRESVVWVSQEITPQIGIEKIQDYLKDFRYGNEDFSGGIKKAWLSSSLKISPKEQAEFLRRLKSGKLNGHKGVSSSVLAVLPEEKAPLGQKIYGKTGSGFSWSDPNEKSDPYRVGWYVGYLDRGNKHYSFATVFTEKVEKGKFSFSGKEAKEISLKGLNILTEGVASRSYPF
jgi:beta-lactamase class D